MNTDLNKARALIQTNEAYRNERNAIFDWARSEERKNDMENPCEGESQDGPHSVRVRNISIELNRRLMELNRKYGI